MQARPMQCLSPAWIIVAVGWSLSLSGQSLGQTLPSKSSPRVVAEFQSVVDSCGPCTVMISAGTQKRSLGTVIDESGLILTKASELDRNLRGRAPGGDWFSLERVAEDPATDLALLRFDPEKVNLVAVTWVEQPFRLGQLIVTPDWDSEPAAFGIVGTLPREIPLQPGFLGVRFENSRTSARIVEVLDDTAAEKAGLRERDLLVRIDGSPVSNFQDAARKIGVHRAGTTLDLEVQRNGRQLSFQAELGSRVPRDWLNGDVSDVSTGFPLAFQHDGVLSPSECGGPALNLDGRAVGLNIARHDRTATYALPATVVLAALERMENGDDSEDAY